MEAFEKTVLLSHHVSAATTLCRHLKLSPSELWRQRWKLIQLEVLRTNFTVELKLFPLLCPLSVAQGEEEVKKLRANDEAEFEIKFHQAPRT